jgi:hypothetical protein
VDLFTTTSLQGNALAVFSDSSGIDDATTQKLAGEGCTSFASEEGVGPVPVRVEAGERPMIALCQRGAEAFVTL